MSRLVFFIKGLDTSKLVKKKITDKTGRNTTKWVKPSQTEAKHKEKGTINEFDKLKEEVAPDLKVHSDTFKNTISEMNKAFPSAKVYGRVKDVESAADKVFIRRQQGYPNYTLKDVQDLTGTRIESDTISDVFESVRKLRDMYEIIDEDDYITNPKGIGYRRYHCICKDQNGKVFEVQLGTKSQTTWADWCHDVYKPQSKTQVKVFDEHKDTVMKYAQATAEYYYYKEAGKEPLPALPPCTMEIKRAFGCLPVN